MVNRSRDVGRQEAQELPLPFAVNCHVNSGCLVEPNLGREDLPFVFLLEAIFHHCHPSFLLSGVGNACGPGLQVISGDLINGRDDPITFEVHLGLGLAPSKLSDYWTNWEVPSYFLLFYSRGDSFFPLCLPVCLDKYLLLGRTS